MEKTYTKQEAAIILGISPETIKARRKQLNIGTVRGNTTFYTAKEILKMIPKIEECKIGRPWPGKSKEEVKLLLKE